MKKQIKWVLNLVWRSQIWLKINWVFIRSHLDHLVWSPCVYMSSTCSTSLNSSYPRSPQLNRQQLNRALHNSTNFTINFIKSKSRLASFASDRVPTLSLSRARSGWHKRACAQLLRPQRSSQPRLPTFLHDSSNFNFTIHPAIQGGNIGWHCQQFCQERIRSNDLTLHFYVLWVKSQVLVGPSCFHLSLSVTLHHADVFFSSQGHDRDEQWRQGRQGGTR